MAQKTTKFLQDSLREGGPIARKAAAMEVMANLDEWLPWLAARELTGFTATKKATEWLLVLKASRGGKQEVAFLAGETVEDLYYVGAYALLFDQVRWKEDKFTSMRSDKT